MEVLDLFFKSVFLKAEQQDLHTDHILTLYITVHFKQLPNLLIAMLISWVTPLGPLHFLLLCSQNSTAAFSKTSASVSSSVQLIQHNPGLLKPLRAQHGLEIEY